ncbi:probable ion channel POLLUX isoform X2 [Quercus robur]|uniref:probable ion channel POLLUX isoform X2 n=1 Tax=Quercus robur TaxID=38942 RepID=UPI00216314BA|nr:probable ion channel POLLUX isoform X2 [Quercus robur]
MEIDIAKLEFDFMGTSVICRSGSPLILADLKKVSVSKARAIIVLVSHESSDLSDARALRVVLSLTGVKEGVRGHVVVEMSDIDNEPLVKLVGGDLIETVVARDVIGRLMIQCALQPGLAQVRRGLFPKIADPPKYPECILFCGWRRDIDDMIMVLEACLAPGSQLWMFNEVPAKEREKKLADGGLDVSRLENIELVHHEGNAVIRRHLENLPLEKFDSILILADELLEDSVVQADSRSLATLLLIRDIQSERLQHKDRNSTSLRFSGFSHSSWIRQMQNASDKSIILSEILDSRTRNLVSVSRISDYVLSNELVSMALAMVAEDKQINRVLEELFAGKIQALLSLLILSKTNGGQTSSLDACNAISYEAHENCFSCYLVLRITLPMI